MPVRSVAEIMSKNNSLGEVLIEGQGSCYGAPNLSDFEGMSEATAIIIAFVIDEDLGLVGQASESVGVNNAITITLKGPSEFIPQGGRLLEDTSF
jgi:hypothetical protein